jgi:hypothetical protein
MDLIATNRIADYIERYSDACIPLLTWLKEYQYYHGKQHMILDQEGSSLPRTEIGVAFPGKGEYAIRYIVNYSAKVVFITWVGKKQQLQQNDFGLEQNEIEIEIVSPEVRAFDYSWKVQEVKTTSTNSHPSTGIAQQIDKDKEVPTMESLTSIDEYHQVISRLETIINTESDTPEFQELLKLLPLVKVFEEHKLKFPSLKPFEVVKHRMNVLEMDSSYLCLVIGDEDACRNFLSGYLILPSEYLDRVYQAVGLKFPASDQRFL